MSGYYRMDENHRPVADDDAWKWLEDNPYRKIVSKTVFPNGARVSTVFLILDHSFDGGAPVLWETMVFDVKEGHKYSDYQERYTSYADAVNGHLQIVAEMLPDGEA